MTAQSTKLIFSEHETERVDVQQQNIANCSYRYYPRYLLSSERPCKLLNLCSVLTSVNNITPKTINQFNEIIKSYGSTIDLIVKNLPEKYAKLLWSNALEIDTKLATNRTNRFRANCSSRSRGVRCTRTDTNHDARHKNRDYSCQKPTRLLQQTADHASQSQQALWENI